MDKLWLPEGSHYGLRISHEPRPDAGSFVNAVPKMVWHTVEGRNLRGAESTLIGNGDEPHFLVSDSGKYVIQFIALNKVAKCLRHPPGTLPTNAAHCIQIEVCGYAAESHEWSAHKYQRLGALAALIEHRTGIARESHHSFTNPKRISASGFAQAHGHIGHCHAPNNDHIDPGKFKIKSLFAGMKLAEEHYN